MDASLFLNCADLNLPGRMSTKFFTNESGNSLLKKFKGAFEHIANMHAFHAVVGYFRAFFINPGCRPILWTHL